MKRFKVQQVYLAFIMLILSGFLITGCGSGGGEVTEHWAPAHVVSILVTPVTASVPVTGNQQFKAVATYSDGTSIDVTASSAWSSGTPVNASVNATSGLATGNVAGTSSVITATFDSLSGSGTLNVTDATSVSFMVTPKLASIPVTGTQQYTAIETFSDATTQDRTAASTWTAVDLVPVSTTPVATIVATTGRATGVNPGTSTITAAYGVYTGTVGLADREAVLTVTTATSESFVVTPATASIPVTGTQQYTAIETFSDTTTQDRTADSTWTAVDLVPVGATGVATISNTSPTIGRATGVNPGTSTITATFATSPHSPATAILTVTAATPPSVDLGSASTFGISATAGVTNTNTAPLTNIHGDVVLGPTAECNSVSVDAAGGFGLCGSTSPTSVPILAGTVISHFYDPGVPASLATIQADLLAAFLSITPPAGPPAAGSLGGATDIPAGTTLGAVTGSALVLGDNLFYTGVYQSLTSIMITGDLTLDAQGDANARFVFQSSSSVGMAAASNANIRSRILLINGAKASNVWWQVASSATLGAYSEFQGNILASASITMETGATSCGRLLAGAFTAGAFVFDANVVSVPGQTFVPPLGPSPAYSTTCD